MPREDVLKSARDAIEAEGEPITLADDSEILAVVRIPSNLTAIGRAGAGTIEVPAHDAAISVIEDESALLVRGYAITVREEAYVVVDRFPTGYGLVRVTLLKKQTGTQTPTGNWR